MFMAFNKTLNKFSFSKERDLAPSTSLGAGGIKPTQLPIVVGLGLGLSLTIDLLGTLLERPDTLGCQGL